MFSIEMIHNLIEKIQASEDKPKKVYLKNMCEFFLFWKKNLSKQVPVAPYCCINLHHMALNQKICSSLLHFHSQYSYSVVKFTASRLIF